MKSYIKAIALSSFILPLAGSCNSDNEPAGMKDSRRPIAFTCMIGTTRATDTAFEKDDEIGIYVAEAGTMLQPAGNIVNNSCFISDGSVWTARRPLYWNEGSYDIYAYYPYSDNVADMEDYRFEIQEDQSTHEGFTLSDFIWASEKDIMASETAVPLVFSHRMSKALIRLEKGEGYEGEIPSDCRVFIHSTATTASIELATGNVSTAIYSPCHTIETFKKSDTEYEAIVVPQNIESRRPLVEVVTGGVSYLMEGKISFKQGYRHTLVVTLSKNPSQTKIEIGGSIGDWN